METPEGVSLELRLAGPMVRAVAWGLDILVRIFLLTLLSMALGMLGESGLGLLLVFAFVLEWFYPVLFEVFWDGCTPGKRALGLQVMHDDGTPVDFTSSFLRNVMRFADFMPLGYQAGLISMLVSREFRRLGDIAAGTVVVYTSHPRREGRLPAGAALPPPHTLRLEEQRAIVDYGLRIDGWGSDRRQELASLLAPGLGEGGRLPVTRLLAMARWLQGQR